MIDRIICSPVRSDCNGPNNILLSFQKNGITLCESIISAWTHQLFVLNDFDEFLMAIQANEKFKLETDCLTFESDGRYFTVRIGTGSMMGDKRVSTVTVYCTINSPLVLDLVDLKNLAHNIESNSTSE